MKYTLNLNKMTDENLCIMHITSKFLIIKGLNYAKILMILMMKTISFTLP